MLGRAASHGLLRLAYLNKVATSQSLYMLAEFILIASDRMTPIAKMLDERTYFAGPYHWAPSNYGEQVGRYWNLCVYDDVTIDEKFSVQITTELHITTKIPYQQWEREIHA